MYSPWRKTRLLFLLVTATNISAVWNDGDAPLCLKPTLNPHQPMAETNPYVSAVIIVFILTGLSGWVITLYRIMMVKKERRKALDECLELLEIMDKNQKAWLSMYSQPHPPNICPKP
jgi:hypothetical protein